MQVGPGYIVSVENISLQPYTLDQVEISSDGKEVKYQASEEKEITLKTTLDGSVSYQARIMNLDVGQENAISMKVDTDVSKVFLSNEGLQEGEYDMQFLHSDSNGDFEFHHSSVLIAGGETQVYNFGEWDREGEMAFEHDRDGDGYFEEVEELDNQRKLNSLWILIIAGMFCLGGLVFLLIGIQKIRKKSERII